MRKLLPLLLLAVPLLLPAESGAASAVPSISASVSPRVLPARGGKLALHFTTLRATICSLKTLPVIAGLNGKIKCNSSVSDSVAINLNGKTSRRSIRFTITAASLNRKTVTTMLLITQAGSTRTHLAASSIGTASTPITTATVNDPVTTTTTLAGPTTIVAGSTGTVPSTTTTTSMPYVPTQRTLHVQFLNSWDDGAYHGTASPGQPFIAGNQFANGEIQAVVSIAGADALPSGVLPGSAAITSTGNPGVSICSGRPTFTTLSISSNEAQVELSCAKRSGVSSGAIIIDYSGGSFIAANGDETDYSERLITAYSQGVELD